MTLPSFGSLYTTFFGDAHAQEEAKKSADVFEARRAAHEQQIRTAKLLEDLSLFAGWKEYTRLLEQRLNGMQRDLENAPAETMPRLQAEIKVLRFALDVVPNAVRAAKEVKAILENAQ